MLDDFIDMHDYLENLLNTRRCCLSFPEEYTELQTSLLDYGMDDFTNPDLCQRLTDIFYRYEPRFNLVTVNLYDNSDSVLRLQIDGLLNTEPTPEPVTLNFSVIL